METDYLLISGIQHFSFCRRQWALIHIEQQWSENVLTAEGRLIHQRVHNVDANDIRDGVRTMRGLRVKSEQYHITGTCDAVEFLPATEGISLYGVNGFWHVQPVEYKRGHSKTSDCDRLQLAAQALCLKEMFSCRINEAAIFYHETRRRESVSITEELREKLSDMLREMYGYFLRGYTPKVKLKKGCDNCSLRDICLPELLHSKTQSVVEYINSKLNDEGLL